MTTVADAIAVLDHAYPPHLAESWDKVGLICGDPAGPADTILLALDCTQEVADAAVAAGADMLVVHHPLLLRGRGFALLLQGIASERDYYCTFIIHKTITLQTLQSPQH